MEKEIFDTLLVMAYESNIKKLYNDKEVIFEYPLKVEEIPFNVLIDFNNKYFEKYKNILLKNAFVNIFESNNEKLIEVFKYDKKEFYDCLDKEIVFRASITKYAFYNLRNKFISKINNDDKIISKHKALYDKIFNSYNSLTGIYRNILLNFLKTFDTEDMETILDEVLLSDIYDDLLIKSNKKMLNKKNINYFKSIIYRLILSDNLVHIKSLYIDNEEDDLDDLFDMLNIDNEFNDDNIDDDNEYELEYINDEKIVKSIDDRILDYINDFVNNKAYITNDYELRLNIYSNFISYNLFTKNILKNVDSINKDLIKQLKKINPLYILDLINFDN